MGLSKRLETIASLVSAGERLVDIGTDHGYIPIHLVQRGQISFALAMDIGEGPLERAKEHIAQYGLQEQIHCRRSNGFEHYEKGEADTVVIAGMGGDLIEKILEAGLSKLPEELILQPQSEWHKVRLFLEKYGYMIAEERMLIEDGKYYVVIQAQRGEMPAQSIIEARYGSILLERQDVVLKQYLDRKYQKYTSILTSLAQQDTQSATERVQELQEELEYIKGALAYYEK